MPIVVDTRGTFHLPNHLCSNSAAAYGPAAWCTCLSIGYDHDQIGVCIDRLQHSHFDIICLMNSLCQTSMGQSSVSQQYSIAVNNQSAWHMAMVRMHAFARPMYRTLRPTATARCMAHQMVLVHLFWWRSSTLLLQDRPLGQDSLTMGLHMKVDEKH